MRTTIIIDDELLETAKEYTGIEENPLWCGNPEEPDLSGSGAQARPDGRNDAGSGSRGSAMWTYTLSPRPCLPLYALDSWRPLARDCRSTGHCKLNGLLSRSFPTIATPAFVWPGA